MSGDVAQRRPTIILVPYGQALQAFTEIVKKSGRDPKDFALHSLRIGGASTLAAGEEVSERVIQRAGGWKSDSYKPYTVNSMEDSRRMSRILGDKDKGVARWPGESTVWGSAKKRQGYTTTVATTSRRPRNG